MRFILILMLALLVGCEAQAKPRRRAPKPPLPPVPKVEPALKKVEVLDFYTTWCGPCKRNAPAIDRLEREGHKIIRIDADQRPTLADSWKIVEYPTYIIVVDGKETFRTNNPAALRLRLEGKKLPRL